MLHRNYWTYHCLAFIAYKLEGSLTLIELVISQTHSFPMVSGTVLRLISYEFQEATLSRMCANNLIIFNVKQLIKG